MSDSQKSQQENLNLLFSRMAHDIKNPVNCLGLNAGIIKKIWKDLDPMLAKMDPEEKLGGLKVQLIREKIPEFIKGMTDSGRQITDIVANVRERVRQGEWRTEQD